MALTNWAQGIVLAGCFVWACGSLSAEDWPRYRGVHGDGISREKDWLGPWKDGQPRVVWKASTGIGYSSMTVAQGRLYTLGNAGKNDAVFCFDAGTGALVWKQTYPQALDPKYYEGGPGSTPTVDGDRVYTVGRHGAVNCYQASDGRLVWGKDLHKDFGCEIPDWGFNGSAHIQGDLVIYNAGTYGVALKKATGEKAWVSGRDASGYGTPVPFQNRGATALAFFGAKYVYAVEPATGREIWRHPWKTDYDVNASDPVVAGNRMFLTSGYGTGCAVIDISGAKPSQVWFNKEIKAQMAGVVAFGDHVYGIDGMGGEGSRLKCVELGTGKVAWASPEAKTGNLIGTSDGRILWLTGSGELVVVEASPKAYREVARAQIGGGKYWTAPVLSNGRVYARNSKGDVVCVDVKGR